MFTVRILKFEFVTTLKKTWRDYKSSHDDEELQKMICEFRKQYLIQGVKVFVNVVPIILLVVIVALLLGSDLSDKSNVTFILFRLFLFVIIAVFDTLVQKNFTVLNNFLPFFMVVLGLVFIKENTGLEHPTIFPFWVPYQMLYFLFSIVH